VQETSLSFEHIYASAETGGVIEATIKNAMDEQSTGSSRVLESTTTIRDLTGNIQTNSKKMLNESMAIQQEMGRLRTISETVKDSACDIAARALDAKRKIDESARALNTNMENIKSVEQRLRVFKTS
jgi:methyl-accepting chemotaxis protein